MAGFNVVFKETAQAFPVVFKEMQIVVSGEYYKGDYEVTPTNKPQVLETKGKSMADNVTIAPIPKNYGLITYHQDRSITIS